MKVVILAGGFGTRISEETQLKPKPLVEIGGRPIIWHIMKLYSSFGFNEFIICCGYKGYLIKEYFFNYSFHNSDITVDLVTNNTEIHRHSEEKWKITLVDTGLSTMTGGRLKRVSKFLDPNEPIFFTYGDGLSNHDMNSQLKFHLSNKSRVTLLAVRPPSRFGNLDLDGNIVRKFEEKPIGENGWVNGGFFILEPSVLDLIKDEKTVWEKEPMEELASRGEISAFKHNEFWQPMDTLRDKNYLEKMWESNNPPWKKW